MPSHPPSPVPHLEQDKACSDTQFPAKKRNSMLIAISIKSWGVVEQSWRNVPILLFDGFLSDFRRYLMGVFFKKKK